MKRITLTLLISVMTLGLSAQKGNLGDNPEKCKENLSLYTGYMAQKQYEDAYRFWIETVKVCPDYNANLYANGVYIMKKLRKKASKERKSALNDSIVWAHEESIKRFGDNPKINETFGSDLILMGKVERGVNLIQKALDSSETKKLRASSIYYYANGLAVLKNKEKRDCEVLVLEYERLAEIIENNKARKGYDKSQEAIDKFLGPCLSCENLLPIIRKKFELAKTDAELRGKILSTLKKRKCTNNDIYDSLVLIECQSDPNSDCYESLGNIELNKGNTNKAIEYFDKAVELTDDNSKKESLTINIAKIYLKNGKTGKAKSYANKALALNSNSGEAYLILANIISRSKCGTSRFDDQAINWAAYDMAAKAKSMDPNVSSQASKAMSSYRSRFPSGTDCFDRDLKKGQNYKTCNGYSTTVK